MNADLLLDAIGLIDDGFLLEETTPRKVSLRRTAIVFIAAILAALLTFMTAMAISPEFKEFVYSFVNVKTQDKPPIPGQEEEYTTNTPTQGSAPVHDTQETVCPDDSIKELGYQEIDGMVTAQYFSTNGIFRMYEEGAFYTCDRNDEYSNPVFWEVTSDGLVSHQATRVQFTLPYGGKDHEIFFDYAIINGRLYEQEWPPKLDEDPYGNGWMTSHVANRTDVVLLELPVSKNKDITHIPLLLDLKTHNVRNLFEELPLDDIYVDAIWLSEDLSRAYVKGIVRILDGENTKDYYTDSWIFDLNNNTISSMTETTGTSSWEYLNDNTLERVVYDQETELSTLYRFDIPSGECIQVFENVKAKHIFTNYVIVHNSGFSYSLWDLRTGERRNLDGLYLAGMDTDESSNNINIAFASRWRNYQIDQWSECFPKIGILNTETGAFQILERDVKEKLSESFYGLLNDTTIVTAAYDGVSGFYIYIYEFTALQS